MRLASSLLIAAALVVAGPLGCADEPCGPTNCNGCCDPTGTCITPTHDACGLAGATCVACGLRETCLGGLCRLDGNGAGSVGTTSSTAASSGSGASTGSSTTAGSSGSSGASSTSATGSTASTTGSASTTSGSSGTSGTLGGTTSSAATGSSGTSTTFSSSTSSATSTTSTSTSSTSTGSTGSTSTSSTATSTTGSTTTGGTLGGTTGGTSGGSDTCAGAAANGSAAGCDFWGALTSHTSLAGPFLGNSVNGSDGTTPSGFSFTVANPGSRQASVSVTSDGRTPITVSVAPGAVEVVRLPWRSLCGTGLARFGWHLTSDVPVTVQQWNPFEAHQRAFRFVGSTVSTTDDTCTTDANCRDPDCDGVFNLGCDQDSSSNQCIGGHCSTPAFTNDASQLLPTHRLGTSYVVASVAHQAVRASGSSTDTPLSAQFSVVATENDTQVRIRFAGAVLSSAAAAACPVHNGSVPAASPGTEQTFSLSAGDVLQFWSGPSGTVNCVTGSNSNQLCQYAGSDLTGSVITSLPSSSDGRARPVMVLGGADCSFAPFDKYACDHLEEALLPYSTWDDAFAVSRGGPYLSATSSQTEIFRVVGGCGATECPNGIDITLEPAVASVSLVGRGQRCSSSGSVTTCHLDPSGTQGASWLEFRHGSSFTASATRPVQLFRYLLGREAVTGATEGDPSLVLVPGTHQGSSKHLFRLPATFAHIWALLVVDGVAATSQVRVNGQVVDAVSWSAIPGGNFQSARVALAVSSAAQLIEGLNETAVSVTLEGFDEYSSFALPGSLSLPTRRTTLAGP